LDFFAWRRRYLLAVLKRLIRYGVGTVPARELGQSCEERTTMAVGGGTGCGKDSCSGLTLRMEEQLALRIRQVFGRSLHIRHVDSGSCNGCEFETLALMNPVYDIQRFGIDFVASPRHADLLLITGGITRNLRDAVLQTYNAAADPKIVVAVGVCAGGNGIIKETYAHFGGIAEQVPVAIYVPGCPPRPQAILEGILTAIDQAEAMGIGGGGRM
jgi:Ni,Fe-hydrogenase III small subunit